MLLDEIESLEIQHIITRINYANNHMTLVDDGTVNSSTPPPILTPPQYAMNIDSGISIIVDH